MSLLEERELTAEERAAIADEPRQGSWILYEPLEYGPLMQDGTDLLIVSELHHGLSADDAALLEQFGGEVDFLTVQSSEQRGASVDRQRGGIHSEPVVRLLAFRLWGARDRHWFSDVRWRLEEIRNAYHLNRIVIDPGNIGLLVTADVFDDRGRRSEMHSRQVQIPYDFRLDERVSMLETLLRTAAALGGGTIYGARPEALASLVAVHIPSSVAATDSATTPRR